MQQLKCKCFHFINVIKLLGFHLYVFCISHLIRFCFSLLMLVLLLLI